MSSDSIDVRFSTTPVLKGAGDSLSTSPIQTALKLQNCSPNIIATPTAAPPHRRALHPFPARMAPEIALETLSSVPRGSTVLDPMCGSGTVLREALACGHRAVGFDLDPLAVLISRVATCQLDADQLLGKGDAIAEQAASLKDRDLALPWIDNDEETQRFVEFWFAPEQRKALRALAWLVARTHGPAGDALRLAVSKIIITKEPSASLARDASHSRPHRVAVASKYDVIRGFQKAVAQIAREVERVPSTGTATVRRADARRLPGWLSGQVDVVVTSPPYGNAIDYLRGHRLSLVWLGYSIPQLRAIRGRIIGSERSVYRRCPKEIKELVSYLGPVTELDLKTHRRLQRFARDILILLKQVQRVLRPDGRAVVVMGNSTIAGIFLENTRLVTAAARQAGLCEISQYSREIPASHRYLPPPRTGNDFALSKRMKEEVVLTFQKTSS